MKYLYYKLEEKQIPVAIEFKKKFSCRNFKVIPYYDYEDNHYMLALGFADAFDYFIHKVYVAHITTALNIKRIEPQNREEIYQLKRKFHRYGHLKLRETPLIKEMRKKIKIAKIKKAKKKLS